MVNGPINHSELGLKQWGEMIARHFAQWQKEQMLKESVEGYITFNCDLQEEGLPCVTVIANEKPLEFYKSRGFKLGDNVRIIICKKEG